MNVKIYASFCIFLLSTQYLIVSASSLVRNKREAFCNISPEVIEIFDKSFENIRNNMDHDMKLDDTEYHKVKLNGGSISNLKNFKMAAPPTCVCMQDFVRISIPIRFLRVTVKWLVTVLEDVLGGLIGAIGNLVSHFVGDIANLLLTIFALEVKVTLSVDVPLTPGAPTKLAEYHVSDVTDISIFHVNLAPLIAGVLQKILTPIVNIVVKMVLDHPVKKIIASEIESTHIPPHLFDCGGHGNGHYDHGQYVDLTDDHHGEYHGGYANHNGEYDGTHNGGYDRTHDGAYGSTYGATYNGGAYHGGDYKPVYVDPHNAGHDAANSGGFHY